MEVEERYEVMTPSLNGYAYIHDLKTDNVLNTYDSCDLLNQQSKRIKELENENKQLHDLPKKIVEYIKFFKGFYFDWKIGQKIFPSFKITEEDLDTILKKFGGDER